MALRYAQPLVFPAVKNHTATVIFAHGLGDTGHGWASAVENWRRRQRLDEVKFVLPHAPSIPITANGGYRMPGWFDIVSPPGSLHPVLAESLPGDGTGPAHSSPWPDETVQKVLDGTVESLRASEDAPGIEASRDYFNGLIQSEIDAGIPADRIVLGGFSQGGAMSIFTGLTATVKLAGIVAMSSWLLLSGRFRQMLPSPVVNQNTPLLMCHGESDPMIRPELNMLSYQVLNTLDFNITRKTYPGLVHSASLEELDDVEEFLNKQLPPLGDAKKPNAADKGKEEL